MERARRLQAREYGSEPEAPVDDAVARVVAVVLAVFGLGVVAMTYGLWRWLR